MTIYIDPTEGRKGTRLPENVVKHSVEVPGLEAATGADILVTLGEIPVDLRPLKDIDATRINWQFPDITASVEKWPLPVVLTAVSLKRAIDDGLLIQRKTGRDLASSVPRLSKILSRMMIWTGRPWLLFVGDLKCHKREAVIDSQSTGFSYNSVQGAIESWQLRGGYISFLSHDNLVMPFLARWHDKLRGLDEARILDRVVQPIEDGRGKKWRSLLTALPGWGIVKANAMAGMCATFAEAIEWITCPDWLKKECGSRPAKVRVSDVVKARQALGLCEPSLQFVVCHVPLGYVARPKFIRKGEK